MGLETIIIATMLAGTGVAAYGAYQQGQAAKAEAKNKASIAAYNAEVARREGEAKRRASEAEAARFKRYMAEKQGEQISAIGRSGVLFSGSPLTVIADTESQMYLDYLNILREGSEKQRQMEAQAGGLMMEAGAFKSQAKYASAASWMGAAGTALTGFGTTGYTAWQMKQAGSWSPQQGV